MFLLAAAFAMSILLVSEGSYMRSVARLDAVPAMSQARNSIQNLSDGVVVVGTAARGAAGGPMTTGARHLARSSP